MTSKIIFSYETPTNSGRRRGWGRHVTDVDTSKRNGYAFEGEFLREGENEMPAGVVIVQKSPCGSVANGWWGWKVGTLQEDGEINWREESWKSQSFLSFRDTVAGLVTEAQAPAPRADQLRQRISTLREEMEAAEAELATIGPQDNTGNTT